MDKLYVKIKVFEKKKIRKEKNTKIKKIYIKLNNFLYFGNAVFVLGAPYSAFFFAGRKLFKTTHTHTYFVTISVTYFKRFQSKCDTYTNIILLQI